MELKTTERRDIRLWEKAASMAHLVKNNGPRLLGTLEAAIHNRPWGQAVAHCVAASGVGRGTLSNWEATFKQRGNMSTQDARLQSKSLETLLQVWALGEKPHEDCDDLADAVTREEKTAPRWASGGEADSDGQDRAFVTLVAQTGLLPRFLDCRVCPYCLAAEVRGSTPQNLDVEDGDDEQDWSKIQSAVPVPIQNGDGYAAALARVHNREQHAKNGNIDRVWDTQGERSSQVPHLRAHFWDQTPRIDRWNSPFTSVIREAESALPAVMYSDQDHGAQTWYTNAGTLHQCIEDDLVKKIVVQSITPKDQQDAKRDTAGSTVPPQTSATAEGGLLRRPKEKPALHVQVRAVGKPPVPDESTEEAEAFAEISLRARWVGVGYDMRFNHGTLERTDEGAKMADAAVNPDPTSPGMLNPQRSNQITGFIAGSVVYGALAGTLSHTLVDWRDLGMKVALYEDLRHHEFIQSSGVDWAWARGERLPTKEITYLNEHQQWTYRATFVSAQALSLAFREPDAYLEVTTRAGNEKWYLNDESVRVISLPGAAGPTDIGQDIWVLSHLTYPLAWVTDVYDMCEAGEQPDKPKMRGEKNFLRNACLVDIHSPADKVVFVVPTQSLDAVMLGGIRYRVALTDRHGNRDPHNLPAAYNIDESLVEILRVVLTYRTSLRAAFSRFTQTMFSGGLNWLEIDSLVTALTVRWSPRIEAYKTQEGEKYYRGGPPGLVSSIYGGSVDLVAR